MYKMSFIFVYRSQQEYALLLLLLCSHARYVRLLTESKIKETKQLFVCFCPFFFSLDRNIIILKCSHLFVCFLFHWRFCFTNILVLQKHKLTHYIFSRLNVKSVLVFSCNKNWLTFSSVFLFYFQIFPLIQWPRIFSLYKLFASTWIADNLKSIENSNHFQSNEMKFF